MSRWTQWGASEPSRPKLELIVNLLNERHSSYFFNAGFVLSAVFLTLEEDRVGGPVAAEPKLQFSRSKKDQAPSRVADVERASFG
jgi:hypothetical protein